MSETGIQGEMILPRQPSREMVAEVARLVAQSVDQDREQESLSERIAGQRVRSSETGPSLRQALADSQAENLQLTSQLSAATASLIETQSGLGESRRHHSDALEELRRLRQELDVLKLQLESTLAGVEPADDGDVREAEARRPPGPLAPGLDLYPWQRDALDRWTGAEHQGVIQAVTGAGKSRVGCWAAAQAIEDGLKVLVIAPTIELMNQWHRTLREALPRTVIGRLGNGHADSLRTRSVLVSTVHSAKQRKLLPTGADGLLIADECHRYGAPTFSRALDPLFSRRLGLTATYDRGDSGNELYLTPYLGGIVKDLWYDEALEQEAISPFRIATVSVRFSEEDQAAYSFHDENAKKARYELTAQHGVVSEPFGEFMRQVTELSEGGGGEATKAARRYLSAFSKRREILAETSCKLPVLTCLAPTVAASGGTLVFTQTKDSARRSADLYAEAGCFAEALYSGMDDDERRLRMSRFSMGESKLISAPRLLDEGIDVPKADLAIIVSASRSRRQMIQRLGRVIRRKPDGAFGRLVILYVEGTVEDPYAEQDSGFLTHCLPHAQATASFKATDETGLIEFLSVRGPGDLEPVVTQ